MLKEIRLFWKVLKNNRLTYFLSMISTIFIQIFSGLTPIVIMITVDSIIGNKEYKYDILKKAVNLIGGRDYLRENIYILAFVIVILTLYLFVPSCSAVIPSRAFRVKVPFSITA